MNAAFVILLLIVIFCVLVLAVDEVQKRDLRRIPAAFKADIPHDICGGLARGSIMPP